ncbi:MAG: SpoIIE family protein phosphatase [Cytophagales bacterium]|nr:SpoIIE family protein phosphatase [Cytophagales bacterium]MDW8383135.1 SpoIIE family protein phosphatase [Flammeovirgaceae bacterium]
MDLQTLSIHAFLGTTTAIICSIWAHKFKLQTLENAKKLKTISQQRRELEMANQELIIREEELKQNLEEITTLQEQLLQAKDKTIEKYLKNIQSSINYASRIQYALLPTDEFFKSCLPDSFIYYQPKDIVSGDFYFIDKIGNKVFLACADCTGHGVPGAFMSLIGSESIYYVLKSYEVEKLNAVFILQELNKKIKKALLKDQQSLQIKDSIEIGLCVIDTLQKKVEFAGAKNSLIYFQKGELFYIQGSKCSIGYNYANYAESFSSHVFTYAQEETMMYLFSDGYKDQFHHQTGKKTQLKRI